MSRILTLFLVICTIAVNAQTLTPLTDEMLVNAELEPIQYYPEIDVDTDDSYVISWINDSFEMGELLFKRYDADHNATSTEITVNNFCLGHEIKHWENEKLVAAYFTGFSDELRFRTINADNSMNAEISVGTNILSYDFDLYGDLMALTYTEDAFVDVVYLRVYDLNANAWITDPIEVGEDELNIYSDPSVVFHTDGSLTVIYTYHQYQEDLRSLQRRTFTPSFEPEIGEYSLWETNDYDFLLGGLDLVRNAEDEILIAANTSASSSIRKIRAWIIERDGDVILDNFIYLQGTDYNWFGTPSAHFFDNGDFLFTLSFQDEGWDDPQEVDSWVMFSNNYNAQFTNFLRLNSSISGYQEWADMGVFSNGDFICAWDGFGADDEQGIYSRRFASLAFPGVRFTVDGAPQVTEEGTSLEIAVRLNTQPQDAVSVDLSTDDPTEGFLDINNLSFDADNWDVDQFVTLTGADDIIDDGNISYAVEAITAGSIDATYAALNESELNVVTLDDDMSFTMPGTQTLCTNETLSNVNAIISNLGSPVVAVTASSSDQSVVDDEDITVMNTGGDTWAVEISGLGDNIAGTAQIQLTATDGIFEDLAEFTVTTESLSLDAGADIIVCEEGSFVVEAINPQGVDITWSDGLTDGEPVVFDPGVYTFYVSGELGMCAVTDSLQLTVQAFPETPLDAGLDIDACEGDEITLSASGPDGYPISWSGAVEDGVPFVQPVGSETYVANASDGVCELSDSVDVNVFPLPPVPTITYMDGVLVSSAVEGNQWYFEGEAIFEEIGQTHEPEMIGNYSVEVTLDGCTSTSDDFYYDFTSLDDLAAEVKIMPNPFADNVLIKATHPFKYSIFNSVGKLVSTGNSPGVVSVETGGWQPGNFMLVLESLNGARIVRQMVRVK